jgi:hypothetical protein
MYCRFQSGGKSSWPAVQHAPAGAFGPPCASSSEAASEVKLSKVRSSVLGLGLRGILGLWPCKHAATSQPEHPASEQPRARRVLYLGKRHYRGQRGHPGRWARSGLWRDAHFGPGPGPGPRALRGAPGGANPPRPARARPGRCGPWRGIMIGPRGLQRPRQLEALPPSDPFRPGGLCAQ